MTIDRYLCTRCKKTLMESGLIYKRITNYQGEEICAWCGRPCAGNMFRIKYGGRVKK